MTPAAGSRFTGLPTLTVTAPDGTTRRVVALRIERRLEDTASPYRLADGEGLDLLARRFYGTESLWWRILDANPIVFPLDLRAGDVLNMPNPAPATRTTRARDF
ncbi:tail protein X [Streptomyces sp. NPDC004609]|uniref:tail protein X n=1 Tax=Streptomyces sp. NPDC004609 TaxID=3364704 RepID=UPI00367DB09B